jgi:methoxymalonate biosynthesis acyl carrier protein
MERRERLREFVNEKARNANQRDVAIGDGDSVLRSGLLNSLSMVEIILFVEQEFGLDITASDIRIEDFDTVDSICALLDRRCPPLHHEGS